MMTSSDLFYGETEPVWVMDSSPYPVRRGRYSSYDSGKYYRTGRPASSAGYYEPAYARVHSDYYGDYDNGYHRSRSDYYDRRYGGDSYYGSSYHDDSLYESRPFEYYDYRKPSTMVLWVPICCEACSEDARNALFEVRGVTAVYCDVKRKRVTVTGTAPPAEVLRVLRKLHKKTRFWGDDDSYY